MLPVWLTDTVTPDLSRAVHYTLLWGLEGVALRTLGTAGSRVPFVNEAALRARLDEAELPVSLVDPGLFEGPLAARAAWLNDADALAETLAFARRVGCSIIQVGALAADVEGYDPAAAAAALRPAAEAAARAGVRLAVRNAAGSAVATGADLAAVLAALAHPAAGADWHPADALASGESPAEGLAALQATPGGIVAIGLDDAALAGGTDWGTVLQPLAAERWDGPLVLSVHGRPSGQAGLSATAALLAARRKARSLA